MNNTIQTIINRNNNEMITYNNIDVNLSLSFNNLTYTLAYENSKKYLNNNSLLFNIEDDNTIYNVFKKNNMQFSYQLNNIIFVDNEKNMHLLNYNLRSYDQQGTQNSLFSINNDIMSLNIVQKSNNSYYPFQTIFAYNSNNSSYIYSDEKNLDSLSFRRQGLYNIDNNNVILNDNRISIDINKFNYNYNLIRNINTNTSHILKNYQENIDVFCQTKKYKNINHSSNIKYNKDLENYKDNIISIITPDQEIDINNQPDNDIILKDTNYVIIDIPIEYEYETVVNEEYQYNKRLCPIDINNIKIEIIEDNYNQYNYKQYISINYLKSFIHDNKCLSISKDSSISEDDSIVEAPVIMKEKCRASIYLSINKDIYKEIYNKQKIYINNQGLENQQITNKIKFVLTISYDYDTTNEDSKIKYNFNCYLDVMGNLFKKLYHNYNYGFNFDKHGEAIGIMLLKKNTNTDIDVNNIIINDQSINLKQYFNTNQNNNKLSVEPINKDVFVNYNPYTIDNILIKSDKIDDYSTVFNGGNIINFRSIETYSNNIITSNVSDIINQLLIPERLKYKDLTFLYKNINNINDLSINIYQKPQEGEYQILLNNIFIDNKDGIIKLNKYNDNSEIVNNHYIMNYDKHKTLFPSIYNYRKSGLFYGDFYTPCLQDYMMMYLFSIEKYFDLKPYKEYISHFCKEFKVEIDDEESITYKYRLLTNQFYKDQSTLNNTLIYQYALKLSKDNTNLDFNNYKIDLYNGKLNNENTEENNINYVNYIWPLFRIPDYSVINSNNYIIMFSEKDNCEHLDYYINNDKHVYINFKSYNDNNTFEFYIFDEKLNVINNIQILGTELIDKDNNIYQLHLYTNTIEKLKIFYIAFIDSENNMNNLKIGSQKYRILGKIFLKNEGI